MTELIEMIERPPLTNDRIEAIAARRFNDCVGLQVTQGMVYAMNCDISIDVRRLIAEASVDLDVNVNIKPVRLGDGNFAFMGYIKLYDKSGQQVRLVRPVE